MEKKITLYIVTRASVVSAIDASNVKETDGIHVVKTGVEVDGVLFNSKRQAQDAAALTAAFGLETVVCSQKRVVKLA